MHIVTKKVYIDKNELIEIKAIEGDLKTRFIAFQFISNNKPVDLRGCNVRVSGRTSEPYNNEIFNDLVITDEKRGIATLELTSKFLTRGVTIYQLHIFKGNGHLSSNIFELEVSESLLNNEAYESSNEFKSFENALYKIDGYDTRLRTVENEIDKTITETTNIKESIKTLNTDTELADEILQKNIDAINLNIKGLKVENGNLKLGTKSISNNSKNVLWSGAGWVFTSGHSIKLNKNIFDMPNGVLLKWSTRNPSGAIHDWNWCITPIYKCQINSGGHNLPVIGYDNVSTFKFVYATEDTITGHDSNNGATNSGLVLREVIEF